MAFLFPTNVAYAKIMAPSEKEQRLPNCNPNDANSPCYIEVYSKVLPEGKVAPLSTTKTIECGVIIKNVAGVTVMKFWQDSNVTWATYWGDTKVNWSTKSTWVANSSYAWRNMTGPTKDTNISTELITVRSDGDRYYLLGYWGHNTIYTIINMASAGSFSCSG